MATIEAVMQNESVGEVFNNTSIYTLRELLDRVRIAQCDNALLVEIDGETYTLPDAFRLSFFR